jgi:SPP1 gp7 family putative phage head morphogenesis protein
MPGLGDIEDVIQRAVTRTIPVTSSACDTIRRHVESSTSVAAALASYPRLRLPLRAFAAVATGELLAGYLLGRASILLALGRLALRVPPKSAPGDLSRLEPREITDWFRKKGLMTGDQVRALEGRTGRKAQALLVDLKAYVDERVKESMRAAIDEGMTTRAYVAQLGEQFDAWGLTRPASHHVETIFDTTAMATYGAGRQEQMSSDAAVEERPFWQYVTAGDDRVRPAHAEMNERIYPADDEIWNEWYPPNGFACRCAVVPITEEEAGEGGGVSARPEGEPDPGFAQSPSEWLGR